eukprot:5168203-Ditylum_brightwellii.AAC.1
MSFIIVNPNGVQNSLPSIVSMTKETNGIDVALSSATNDKSAPQVGDKPNTEENMYDYNKNDTQQQLKSKAEAAYHDGNYKSAIEQYTLALQQWLQTPDDNNSGCSNVPRCGLLSNLMY